MQKINGAVIYIMTFAIDDQKSWNH